MFLLDTNAISELRRPDKAGASLVARAASAAPAELFISAITLFEVGTVQARRKDAAKGKVLQS
ncbi:hypothetical protein [Azospirillum argentinense]